MGLGEVGGLEQKIRRWTSLEGSHVHDSLERK